MKMSAIMQQNHDGVIFVGQYFSLGCWEVGLLRLVSVLAARPLAACGL